MLLFSTQALLTCVSCGNFECRTFGKQPHPRVMISSQYRARRTMEMPVAVSFFDLT